MGRSGATAQAAEVWPILERDGVRRMGWGCFALHAEALLHAAPGRQGMMFLRSAPVQGVSRPPHTASRDCRNGSPLARANPCAPTVSIHGFFTRCRRKRVAGLRRLRAEVVARPPASSGESPHAHTGRRRKSHWHPLPAHPHAAQRAVPGWRGGLGRAGADLASAGSMRPPPSPARHVSTAWLATTHASRETARHHTSQPRNGTPPPIRIASWRARMPA